MANASKTFAANYNRLIAVDQEIRELGHFLKVVEETSLFLNVAKVEGWKENIQVKLSTAMSVQWEKYDQLLNKLEDEKRQLVLLGSDAPLSATFAEDLSQAIGFLSEVILVGRLKGSDRLFPVFDFATERAFRNVSNDVKVWAADSK